MLLNGEQFDEKEIKINNLHTKSTINISKLLKEINLDNIHQEFYIFCYLLWNGYFSVDKNFVFNSQDVIDENNQVFLGYGCCRHNAQLLTEVLKNNQIYALNLAIHLEKYKSNFFDIVRKIEKTSNIKAPKNQVNHLVTIVKLNRDVFLLDPTNPSECELTRSVKVNPLTGKYEVNKKMLDHELDYLLYNYYPFKWKNSVTKKDIEENYKIAKEICIKKQNLFDDFYFDNHNNYSKIKKLVLSKNNH